MNINELIKDNNNNTETKEDVIKNLENTAIKIKAENRLEELDKKSEKVIEVLEKFSEKVPIMVDRLEIINNGLKIENFYNILKNIDNNSEEMKKISNTIYENKKNYEEEVISLAKEKISLISKKANENINKREYFYYFLDKSIIIVFFTVFIINIMMVFFYKKQLNQIDYEINEIHQILMSKQKYWIDENSYKIFIQQNKKN